MSRYVPLYHATCPYHGTRQLLFTRISIVCWETFAADCAVHARAILPLIRKLKPEVAGCVCLSANYHVISCSTWSTEIDRGGASRLTKGTALGIRPCIRSSGTSPVGRRVLEAEVRNELAAGDWLACRYCWRTPAAFGRTFVCVLNADEWCLSWDRASRGLNDDGVVKQLEKNRTFCRYKKMCR